MICEIIQTQPPEVSDGSQDQNRALSCTQSAKALWVSGFSTTGCQPNLPIRISSTTTSNDTELNINCTYFKHLYDFIAKVNLSIIVLKCPFILFSKFICTMFRRILELIHSPINLLQLRIQSTECVSPSCEIGVIQYVVSSSKK